MNVSSRDAGRRPAVKFALVSTLAILAGLIHPQIMQAQQSAPYKGRLRLATTTSTEQSGLLAVLLPAFEKKMGLIVDVVAVGTEPRSSWGKRATPMSFESMPGPRRTLSWLQASATNAGTFSTTTS